MWSILYTLRLETMALQNKRRNNSQITINMRAMTMEYDTEDIQKIFCWNERKALLIVPRDRLTLTRAPENSKKKTKSF